MGLITIGNVIGGTGGDNASGIASLFSTRVLADGGTFEGSTCLVNQIRSLKRAGFYDKASLILTPNGYREGKLYSLLPTSGAGDFTFTRAGTAYRKGPSLVETVPYNLLSRSEQFDNAAWGKASVTVSPNATTAPDGTLTADSILETAATANFAVFQTATKPAVSAEYTQSVYVKPNQRQWIFIQSFDGASGITRQWFDLTNGVVGQSDSVAGQTIVSKSIVAAANGFYKCSVTFTTTAVASVRFGLFTSLGDGDTATYLGDVTKGVYAWGAELKLAAHTGDYQRTTDRFAFPKLDYTLGSCPDLLMEPQRTNLLLRSEEFDNASWSKTDTTVTANNITAPDSISTADLLTAGTAGTAILNQNVTITANATIALSFYMKRGNTDWVRFGFGDTALSTDFATVWFNLNTGVVGSTALGGAATLSTKSIVSVGSGWYRCIMVGAVNGGRTAITAYAIDAPSDGGTARVNNSTRYQWGAQLEQASYASSYIPTTTATVTRLADAITALSAAALIGQTEGTVYFEGRSPNDGLSKNICLSNGGNNNIRCVFGSTGLMGGIIETGGVNQANVNQAYTTGTFYKMAIVYRTNYCAVFINGVKVGEDLTVTVPATDRIQFAYGAGSDFFYGRNNVLAIAKTAISDAEALTLTTL